LARNSGNRAGAKSRSVGRTVVDALDDAGHAVTKAAARTREEADDIWAEARNEAGKDTGRDAAVTLGLAATVALGAVELPIAAALGAGYAILRRRR
jgi:tetrahydromethanopterin S-methyltransferase subunit G